MEIYDDVAAADEGEELYDDVSAVPFNGHPSPQTSFTNHSQTATYPPKGQKPPAQPPAYKGGKGPPPIPTRAATTTLTSSGAKTFTSGGAKTLPIGASLNKNIEQKKKPAPIKKGKKPAPASGGGGGGIDMGEIMLKARSRSSQVFEDLEKKPHASEDDDDKHAAPWLKQLRKTPRPNQPDEKDDNEVPEFLKRSRAKTEYAPGLENDSSSPELRAGPPPVATKPRSATVFNGGEGAEKPHTPPTKPKPIPRTTPQGTAKPPAVASKPPAVASKPPAIANKPPSVASKPPGIANKPPPVASKPPTTSPKPPVDLPPKPDQALSTDHASGQSGAVKALAATLFKQQAQTSPGVSPKLPEGPKTISETSSNHLPPKPPVSAPPSHFQTSPASFQPPPPSFQPPPSPSSQFSPPSSQPPPPFAPPPPPEDSPPQAPHLPPQLPPPSQGRLPPATLPHQPPVLEKPFPSIPNGLPPSTYKPPPSLPLPSQPPPFQATHAESTPVTTVLRYRRLPLPAVDPFNPPPLPPQNTKPKRLPLQTPPKPRPPLIPTESMVMEDEEIYDDTFAPTQADEEDQEIYDDVMAGGEPPSPPKSLPPPMQTPTSLQSSFPPKLLTEPPLPQPPPITSLPPKPPSVQQPPSFAAPPPPSVPDDDPDQEEYEDLATVQTQFQGGQGSGDGSQGASGGIPEQEEVYEDFQEPPPPTPTFIPPSVSAATLSLPPPPSSAGGSNNSSPSPTFNRKGLSKKQQKEEEKKQKELKKLEQQREKERKKREELRAKNRAKCLKNLKQFQLPNEILPLFTVEVLEDRGKGKDHLSITKGERLSVILLAHPNLEPNKYLAEKDDGMIGFVDKEATLRTAYQTTQELGIQQPPSVQVDEFGYGMGEDLYESVGVDDMENGGGMGHPPLPSMNSPHRPPPSQAPPAIPEESQELYECLPEDN